MFPDNRGGGGGVMMRYSALSGGVASAVATQRALEKYGDVELIFSDVLWEDEDLYRFLDDLSNHWGVGIKRIVDGRRPLELADERKFIFNQKTAPCSYDLKIKPFIELLEEGDTVFIGIDWTETHRVKGIERNYNKVSCTVEFPLLWQPYEMKKYIDVLRSWGIEPPRLYSYGFPHNNCGGRCVRQGVMEWRRLMKVFPERFAEVRDWEQRARSHGDARENYAIARDQRGGEVKPMTLAEIEQMEESKLEDYGGEDLFSCLCGY